MAGKILYFFVHHKSHMGYSGIEPGDLLENPATKKLSQAGNAVPRQPKDHTRLREALRLLLSSQAHFQKQTLLCGTCGRQYGTRLGFFIQGQLRFSFSITLHIYLMSGAGT